MARFIDIESFNLGDSSDGDVTIDANHTVAVRERNCINMTIENGITYNLNDDDLPHIIHCVENFICRGDIRGSSIGSNRFASNTHYQGGNASAFEDSTDRSLGIQLEYIIENMYDQLEKGMTRGGANIIIAAKSIQFTSSSIVRLKGSNTPNQDSQAAGGGGTLYLLAENIVLRGEVECDEGRNSNSHGQHGGEGGIVALYTGSYDAVGATLPSNVFTHHLSEGVPLDLGG